MSNIWKGEAPLKKDLEGERPKIESVENKSPTFDTA